MWWGGFEAEGLARGCFVVLGAGGGGLEVGGGGEVDEGGKAVGGLADEGSVDGEGAVGGGAVEDLVRLEREGLVGVFAVFEGGFVSEGAVRGVVELWMEGVEAWERRKGIV